MSYKVSSFYRRVAEGIKDFEISIGGFLYLAFLPDANHKILCISSDYI